MSCAAATLAVSLHAGKPQYGVRLYIRLDSLGGA
jgi:hypothetical protein